MYRSKDVYLMAERALLPILDGCDAGHHMHYIGIFCRREYVHEICFLYVQESCPNINPHIHLQVVCSVA